MPKPAINFAPTQLVKKPKKSKLGLAEEQAPAGQPLGVQGVNTGSLSGTLGSFPIGQQQR